MYQDILVPTDGSESMETVLDHTIEIASDRDVTIHVLYVIDDQAFLTLDEQMKEDVLADLRAEGTAAIDAVETSLEEYGLTTVTEMTKGKPADEIVSYVQREQVDLVTMGTHGDDYTENMLGSTSQQVVTQASAPVLTVDVA